MKSACLLHQGSVTFVMLHLYIINLTRKKRLERSFSAVHPDIIFVKEAEWKPCDVQPHYIRANCGVEIDANLESTGHFEQQKNPLACRSLSVLLNSDIQCLQTILLIFKFANHRTKEFFVSTANKPLVGTLMTIGDVTVSITMKTRLAYSSVLYNNLQYN